MVTPELVYNGNQTYTAAGDPIAGGIVGKRIYELSNHLGNVLVTVSDRKLGVDNNSDGVIDYYVADVITANDMYSGGMEMPGRTFTTGNGYRYSINGQEKTTEIGANTTTAEYWQYDARIVRRWNVDPVLKDWESPYMAFSGNPIWFADIDGSDTTKPAPFSYLNTVSSNGNWLNGALLLPGNTYVKAQNTVAATLNGAVDLAKTSSDKGLGPGLMGMIDGWGEDLKDWWNGTKEYHTETSASQQLKDAGQWISNPDNVYGAISDAAIIYGTGRLQAGIAKNWSMKGNVPEWGSGGLIKAESVEMTTVGRWMSKTEYKAYAAGKPMLEGSGGVTFVTTKGAHTFTPKNIGDVYAEFQVPTNSLLIQPGPQGWAKVLGPTANQSMKASLLKQGGQMLPTPQNLTSILKVKTK
jgi:hypothetical protein